VPEPFRPELRGLLLDPRGARSLERDAATTTDAGPLWPASKVVAEHLAPYLATAGGAADRSP
jgi:hypothetical protein